MTVIPHLDAPQLPARPFLWGANEALAPAQTSEGSDVRQEIRLLTRMGLNAYRLSVDWARAEPRSGEWSMPYLSDLRAHILDLRDAGIEPILTLHRGLDPTWFVTDDGWLRGDAVQLFCRYVVKVVEELGDLITFYVTIDGPVRLARGDMRPDDHAAPAGKASAPFAFSMWAAWRTLRALLHAHGAARRTLRAATPRRGPRPRGAPLAGPAHHFYTLRAHHAASVADRAASTALDYTWNWLPLRILTDGRLHAPLGHGQVLPELCDSLDFIGVTVAPYVEVDAARRSLAPSASSVEARSFAHLLRRVAILAKPLLITADSSSGDVEDARRELFLQRRLAEIATARQRGIPLHGYFCAPLFDPVGPADAMGSGLALPGGPGEAPRARPSTMILTRGIQIQSMPT